MDEKVEENLPSIAVLGMRGWGGFWGKCVWVWMLSLFNARSGGLVVVFRRFAVVVVVFLPVCLSVRSVRLSPSRLAVRRGGVHNVYCQSTASPLDGLSGSQNKGLII